MNSGERGRTRTAAQRSKMRNLRSLRILLIYPQDREGVELLEHLNRIGCQVETSWPPPKKLPDDIDIVFLALGPLVEGQYKFEWPYENTSTVLIVIVDYENPIVIEKLLKMKPQAVIGRPLRPFGVLANLLVSISIHERERKLCNHIERLKSKVKSKREIDKAVGILAQSRGVTEQEAYDIIRRQAMNKRTTIEAISSAIVHASDVLNS